MTLRRMLVQFYERFFLLHWDVKIQICAALAKSQPAHPPLRMGSAFPNAGPPFYQPSCSYLSCKSIWRVADCAALCLPQNLGSSQSPPEVWQIQNKRMVDKRASTKRKKKEGAHVQLLHIRPLIAGRAPNPTPRQTNVQIFIHEGFPPAPVLRLRLPSSPPPPLPLDFSAALTCAWAWAVAAPRRTPAGKGTTLARPRAATAAAVASRAAVAASPKNQGSAVAPAASDDDDDEGEEEEEEEEEAGGQSLSLT